jgi:hypothetical protein
MEMAMSWIYRSALFLALVLVGIWGHDKQYGLWSLGFVLAAWILLEPRLRPVLILLPVAGMTGVAALLWQHPWY